MACGIWRRLSSPSYPAAPGINVADIAAAVFVIAKQRRGSRSLQSSLGERFECFKDQLTGCEIHVAAHLIEIESRVDQRSVEIEDDAVDWHAPIVSNVELDDEMQDARLSASYCCSSICCQAAQIVNPAKQKTREPRLKLLSFRFC